jgi:hypothetical protein
MSGGVPDDVTGEGAQRALDEAGGAATDGLKPGHAAAGMGGNAGVRVFVIHGFWASRGADAPRSWTRSKHLTQDVKRLATFLRERPGGAASPAGRVYAEPPDWCRKRGPVKSMPTRSNLAVS